MHAQNSSPKRPQRLLQAGLLLTFGGIFAVIAAFTRLTAASPATWWLAMLTLIGPLFIFSGMRQQASARSRAVAAIRKENHV